MWKIKHRREKLTAGEMATLQAICEKWNRIGLSTAPADRDEAERGAVEFYLARGLGAPKKFFWFDSFMGWEENKKSKCTIVKRTWDKSTRHLVELSILNSYNERVGRYFKSSFIQSVEEIINESVFCQMPYGSRDTEIRLAEYTRYGQRNAASLAARDFFTTTKYVTPYHNLISLIRIVGSCGLFVPGEKPEQVALFERPSVVRLDDQRRPHCVDGPAVEYRDGWKGYALHGVPVPWKYIVTPANQINLEELLQERNAQVRMAVFSRIGFLQLLNSTSHKIVSRANGNSLVEFEIRYQPYRALHLKWEDKTGPKETVIPVPRTRSEFGPDCPDTNPRIINDCEAVRRWTLGWPKDVEVLAET